MDAYSPIRAPQVDYEFAEGERQHLVDGLLALRANPYDDHDGFLAEISALAATEHVSKRFREMSEAMKARDKAQAPITFIRNAPIDPIVPEFDWVDPVVSKRALKTTYVCEGFLAIVAHLQQRPAVAHLSINDGDFYHDIFPKKDMAVTQSQKTEGTLHFHKDFTNHFARPDCVYTLTVRNSLENEVISTYVSNADAIGALPEATQALLRLPIYRTPYDDISKRQSNVALGEAPDHAILERDVELRVFEGRTIATTPEGAAALKALLLSMHDNKVGIHQTPGDFVAIENDFCLHGREVKRVTSVDDLRKRWLIKTHNVVSLGKLDGHFLPDRPRVING